MRKKLLIRSRACAIALALCALAAPLAAQKQWVTNQAARLVVGQESFTRANPVSSRTAIGSAAGVAAGGDRLFIAEGNRLGAMPVNNRVLIYNRLSGFLPGLDDELAQTSNCPACVGLPDIVLGQPDFETFEQGADNGLKSPGAVATDGVRLAVADTNNNRVLIWNTIPAGTNTPPDVVVGQSDFSDSLPRTSSSGMRGPQGVWLDQGKLFVADTQNGRVLIWNSIPSSNGQTADVVVGQTDFDTRPEPDLTRSNFDPSNTNMIDPTSVTATDGKMFISDLGFERVLIYFSIPTSNGAPADVVVGQPDFTTAGFVDHDNNPFTRTLRRSVVAMCEEIGQFDDDGTITPNDSIFPTPISRDLDVDDDGEIDPTAPRLPKRCEATLNFPRFALSDGERLYISDSGNDRILIYNQIPQENGAKADVVLGQPNFIALTEDEGPGNVRAPASLAHDGENLYVADPFSRRILVFTPAEPLIGLEGVRNGASFSIRSTGFLEWEGSTAEDQLVTVEVARRKFEFRTEPEDTAADVRDKMMQLINDDPDGVTSARPFNGAGIFAKAGIKFSGSVRPADLVTIRIGDRTYEYVTQGQLADPEPFILVDRFNFIIDQAEDPEVTVDRDIADQDTLLIVARAAGPSFNGVPISIEIAPGSPLTAEISSDTLAGGTFPRRARLTSRIEGRLGNAVELSAVIGGAGITTRSSGGRLTGGSDARMLPQGSFASIFGENLAAETLFGEVVDGMLSTKLGGVQVYCNGRLCPIYSVSPNQVNFMVPWEIEGRGSSTYVRREVGDGTVMTSIPRANQTARAAPGIFAFPGSEPRQAVALHGQGQATGQVAIQPGSQPLPGNADRGQTVGVGGTVTITVNGRNFAYTTIDGDTSLTVRDKLVTQINDSNDPDVFATAGQQGFFSARVTLTFAGIPMEGTFPGEPKEGDVVTLNVNGRTYVHTVREGDTLAVIRNVLVDRINAGRGDPEVTARRLLTFGILQMQVIARSLGDDGNDIPFSLTVSDGVGFTVTSSLEGDTLEGGQTPPVVILTARNAGADGNEIEYTAATSDVLLVGAAARSETLCCGNIPFSVITQDNPAIPGEDIILYASGLGLPAVPNDAALPVSGAATPLQPLFNVPAVADDFVSSLAGGRTGQIRFVGLAPGFVGLYQINLQLNEQLPDDPGMPLTIAQVLFISNTVTIPVKNLRPIDGDQF